MSDERIRLVRSAMERAGLDSLVCRLPANVLMLTGYLSALGRAFVVFPRAGSPALLVPAEEVALARQGWVLNVQSFDTPPPATPLARAAERGLARIARHLALEGKRVGFEGTAELLPPSAMPSYAVDFQTVEMYRRAFAESALLDAAETLTRAAAVKTCGEVERIRWACEIAAFAFHRAREVIRPGATEGEVAGAAAEAVLRRAPGYRGVRRVFPFPRVLSGIRGIEMCRLDADTSGREIQRGDAVVVDLALSADGYAVQLARTFFAGPATPKQQRVYEACLAAHRAALAGMRDGAGAAEVAARVEQELTARGFGGAFCPRFGHGVGFQAAIPDQPPVLAATSPDTLSAGMTHTLDLAVILPDVGGVRIADVVLVQPVGADLLSRIERSLEWVSG